MSPVAAIGAIDWMLINLLNKLTDLAEDRVNQIHGTDFVDDHKRVLSGAWIVVFVLSFVWTTLRFPELTLLRVIVQVIGLGYSLPLIPTLRGFRRFKDLYFFKNFMSAVLFAGRTTRRAGTTPSRRFLLGRRRCFVATMSRTIRTPTGACMLAAPPWPLMPVSSWSGGTTTARSPGLSNSDFGDSCVFLSILPFQRTHLRISSDK